MVSGEHKAVAHSSQVQGEGVLEIAVILLLKPLFYIFIITKLVT
jgi:hypothetical protein